MTLVDHQRWDFRMDQEAPEVRQLNLNPYLLHHHPELSVGENGDGFTAALKTLIRNFPGRLRADGGRNGIENI